jgi:hypothetical protein
MTTEISSDILARIELIADEDASHYTATAAKRGRNPKYPYVPVIAWKAEVAPYKHSRQILNRAFVTREEAVAHAQSVIDAERAGLARKLADPRHRALRGQYGLPRDL